LVGHRELKMMDPQKIQKLTPARLVVDTVGVWENQTWSEAGFTLIRLGVGKTL
jgi:hypothetical protein